MVIFDETNYGNQSIIKLAQYKTTSVEIGQNCFVHQKGRIGFSVT